MTKILTLGLITTFLISASLAQAQTRPTARRNNAASRPNDDNDNHSRSYDDGTAMSNPNAISVELLGRGGAYSINYDRSLSDQFGLGVGFSAYSISSGSVSNTVLILPIYGNFYFSPGPSRGFLTAGFDIVSESATVSGNTFGASGALIVLGGGYEYRGEGGFLFRAAPYLLAGNGGVAITIGLGFGYAF